MSVFMLLSFSSFLMSTAFALRVQSLGFFLVGGVLAVPLAGWSLWMSGWSLGATLG